MNNGDMARLTLSFLGTFEVILNDQPITRFRSANNQGLLVYLALNGDRAVAREVLAALFWPEEAEKTARNNLRQALYHLRTLLGDTNNESEPYLTVTRHTVRFNPVSDAALDVKRFQDAIDGNDLVTAVRLYQGDLLPGFTCDSLQFEEWLRQEREDLHALALEAMFEVTQQQMDDGALDDAQRTARRQLKLEPWREAAFRQLMQAYALAGDRGTALAQFAACREILREEIGVEPSAETVALFEAIKDGGYGARAMDDVLPVPARIRHNLPAETTPLIGRELELAKIGQLLSDDNRRLITVVGPGGMGKTRLALAAGAHHLQQFADGVYFVDLAPLTEAEEIIPAVAAALDYQAPDKSQKLAAQLLKTLRRRRLLLILDNFEHLLNGSSVVNELLHNCPQLVILVTSRQRLNLASESRFELAGLAFPDSITAADALDYTAVQLFTAAAERARADFELTDENVADVIRICRLVQGMPLGLVLAAAWLEMLATAEIAAEIEKGLDFLAAELADLPPRQRSMQAIFEGSWLLMVETEQEVFAKLSIFRGGFSREAAEEVAGANLRVLLSLVNKSLLQRQRDNGRFTMHELLRQFAAGRRRQVQPFDHVSLDHCRYFARMLAGQNRYALVLFAGQFARKFEADTDNIQRAWSYALEQGLAGALSDIGQGITALGIVKGAPARSLIRSALGTLREGGVSEHDRTILNLRLIELYDLASLDHERAQRLMLALVPQVEAHGDLELRYRTYYRLSHFFNNDGDPEALLWAERTYRTGLEMDDIVLVNMAKASALWIRVDLGLLDESIFEDLQTLLLFFEQRFANSYMHYGILWSLCVSYFALDMFEQAILFGKQSLNIAKRARDLLWISHAVDKLAEIYVKMDRPQRAADYLLDQVVWHLAIGQVWQTLGTIGGCAARHPQFFGRWEGALSLMSMVYYHPESVPIFRTIIDYHLPGFKLELGEERFAEGWERGKGMDFDTAVSQMRTMLSSGGGL